MDKFEQGMNILREMVDQEILDETVEQVRKIHPDFARMIVETGFAEFYGRPGLDAKQRELITISSLISQGATDQLTFHIHAALKVGLTPNEIIETVIHCVPYNGFPKAISAFGAVMKIFAEKGIKLETEDTK